MNSPQPKKQPKPPKIIYRQSYQPSEQSPSRIQSSTSIDQQQKFEHTEPVRPQLTQSQPLVPSHAVSGAGTGTQLSTKLTQQFGEQIYNIVYSYGHLVCSAPGRIIVYDPGCKYTQNIKVSTEQFTIVEFPPYIFGCFITQFIYLYTEQSLKDITKIIKYKISKLNIKSICSYNKGYFMAGSNRSPLPGGNLTNKRSIYFVENLTDTKKNKPSWEIPLPKSENPVTVLQFQNPYLMCYCQPFTYIISAHSKEILISFEKEFRYLSLLEGRYSLNCVNMIGIGKDRMLFGIDVQKYPIYGVQLNQYKQKINSVCQSKQGLIYACTSNLIFTYNLFKKQKKILKKYQETTEVLQIICTPKNWLIALVVSKELNKYQCGLMDYRPLLEKEKEEIVHSVDVGLLNINVSGIEPDYEVVGSNVKGSFQSFYSNGNKNNGKVTNNSSFVRANSLNLTKQVQEKRYIQIFNINA